MSSTLIPSQDLVPSVSSRIVTIDATSMLEAAPDGDYHVDFILPQDLHVAADNKIIMAGSERVVLDQGQGSIRLPTYDPDAKTVDGSSDWVILVKKSWPSGQYGHGRGCSCGCGGVYAIRVPVGTTTISLADLPAVRALTAREQQYAITGATASVTVGASWDASLTLSGGVLVLDLTVPPGAVSERRQITELPADVLDWVGVDKAGIFAIPSTLTTETIANRPQDTGLAIVKIDPVASGGSLVTWSEYGSGQRVWKRTVSTTASRQTTWRRVDAPTRTVLHQLSQPGAPTLTDAEASRHVRLPIRVPGTVNAWDLTLKNFNERAGTNFGDLNFVDVYIAPRAVDANGAYTADFAELPTNLGTPQPTGSIGSNGRRYVIEGIGYTLEAGREYILAYAYTDPDSSPNHLGIGGSYTGTNPAGVSSMSVTNAWSPYTPLDVYLKVNAPQTTPTIAFMGSSSETGLESPYPLRDSWAWRVAESRGAFPVMLGQSGQTLAGLATGFVWSKVNAMDRVDETWLCAGSNDIYGGANLTTVQARHGVVADQIREYLSDRIVGVDVFPRAIETEAVRTVRIAYNAWLRGLPNGLAAAFDRAAAVSDAAGLLRPEFNSGDDVHLNATGQRVLSGAVLNPTAALAPVIDSGVVNGASLLSAYTSSTSNITLQRVGPHVEYNVRARQFNVSAAATGATLLTLPAGYRPSALYRDEMVSPSGVQFDVNPSGAVTVSSGSIPLDSYVTFRLAHLTTDQAPTG